jgi:two-component system, NtrC family, response regulator HydG
VRVEQLAHPNLLELDPQGGTIRFAGQRALLLDAVALGLLRKQLSSDLGVTATQAVLTRLGFAHGWRVAEAMQEEFTWDNPEEWRRAGLRMHALAGLFRPEGSLEDALESGIVQLATSYEAEQHLVHLGRSDEPVCHTICGLISGYLSRCNEEPIYFIEDRCAARGHVSCRMVGKTAAQWGESRALDLVRFAADPLDASLDDSLREVTQTLKVAEQRLRDHRRELGRVLGPDTEPDGLVVRAPAMRQLVDVATRVAGVDTTLIITGESGVGKERIARLIHERSGRADGPFIAVNCGAITETLLESELFGHARGAFTGATHERLGLFEAANKGTLLLDEIGELPLAMQVKLLRVLQEREIRRVGESHPRKVDVRILAATNLNLAEQVESKTFRADLFYRLNVVELKVPPLRDRSEDIVPLARFLLANAVVRLKRPVTGMSPAVADQLLRYAWPGNVRELANVIERAVVLATGKRIEVDDLPEEVRVASPRRITEAGTARPLSEVEREHILAALALNNGVQARAAKQLQIGSATLYRKLKAYGYTKNGSDSPRHWDD